jgi:hypothetical protein
METKTEFKFDPLYGIILTLFTVFLLYTGVNSITPPSISWENFIRCLLLIGLSYFLLPITFKLIFNLPSIVLTDDCLKNNIGGYSIEWDDISDIQLNNGGYRSFGNLIINLKNPDKYFNTPLKKALYWIKQLFSAYDILIKVDLISGKNEEIFDVVKVYWTKHYENKVKKLK